MFLGGSISVAQDVSVALKDRINSELSCQCGCGLLVSKCTMNGCMCENVRAQVSELVDEGKTRKQVKQAMIEIYGERILAAPPKSGFNLSAYILPFFFLFAGGLILYSILSRWITEGSLQSGQHSETFQPGTGAETNQTRYMKQIEDELKDYTP